MELDELLEKLTDFAKSSLTSNGKLMPTGMVWNEELRIYGFVVSMTEESKQGIRALFELEVMNGAGCVAFASEGWSGTGKEAEEYTKTGRKLASWAFREEVLIVVGADKYKTDGRVFQIIRAKDETIIDLEEIGKGEGDGVHGSRFTDNLPWQEAA